MKIDGLRIVLTGAASGIGLAILEKLAAFPCQVMAVDRDEQGLQAITIHGEATIFPYAADLGSSQAVDALFEQALQRMGGIDLFIANAGFAYYEQIFRPDWAHMETIYQVNVFSPIYSAEKMRLINQGRPYKVVVTASAMGLLGLPGYALYSSTKAALHRFAEAYRSELEDPRSLALVYPIGTRTRFFGAAAPQAAPQPWPTQTAEQVAQAVLTGIQRDQQSIYPSTLFRVFIQLPFLAHIEQAIEARRLRGWLKDKEGG